MLLALQNRLNKPFYQKIVSRCGSVCGDVKLKDCN
ncbi:hypothetical protein SOVF_069980 [Spinacia oleracea]|nr:hypothetical protein SOVF_069980 [Spinacia oleracea]